MKPLQARLHELIRRSVVDVYILPPEQTEPAREEPFQPEHVYGTAIVLESKFMYLLANHVRFRGKPSCHLVLKCPDGQQLHYSTTPSIHLAEDVAGICCPNDAGYDTTLMQPVPLSPSDVAKSQDVHVFTPERMLLTSGTVMGIYGRNFQHNCSKLVSSAFGAPVVDDSGHLVGICTDFRNDYLEAISTQAIAAEIEGAQGRDFISIDWMLKHLQSSNRL